MLRIQLIAASVLMLAGGLFCGRAWADPCSLTIESNDQMQYNVHDLTVPSGCTQIAVTLRHTGRMPAKVMGHDWVLARSADVTEIVNAGLRAGAKHGYLPENDPRIIAATKIVGGGESDTVTFSASGLQDDQSYTFFCTTPGHVTVMRGRFLLGTRDQIARAK